MPYSLVIWFYILIKWFQMTYKQRAIFYPVLKNLVLGVGKSICFPKWITFWSRISAKGSEVCQYGDYSADLRWVCTAGLQRDPQSPTPAFYQPLPRTLATWVPSKKVTMFVPWDPTSLNSPAWAQYWCPSQRQPQAGGTSGSLWRRSGLKTLTSSGCSVLDGDQLTEPVLRCYDVRREKPKVQ